MKILISLLTLSVFIYSTQLKAQINMTQIGFLDIPALHSTELNDIWGYTDEDGNEYAIVGCTDGTSIVDISDPTTPVEIDWIPGSYSIWRDMKTVGDYAYVTTEADDGLLIIDLSPLPASTILPTANYFGPGGDPWTSAHNIYADDSGYAYISGANRGNGGIIILDVFTDPMNPIEVGIFDTWYAHDVYVQNDTGYFSNVWDGFFSIVDLTDKSAPVFVNSFGTIDGISHNAWASTDGDYLFTTDETIDGYIASYDISDPMSITLLDQIQSSPGSNIIPHNCHVLGNYLITSYYVDGVVVHDISDPSTMAEVASFDTSPGFSGSTYNGCWGVYPFFASEMIIASDSEEGLYILQTDFLLAGYLAGNVTDIDTGLPINLVTVDIVSTTATGTTDPLGDYSIGTFEEGTFTANYTRTGYFPETATVSLTNGIITIQDIQMDKEPVYDVVVNVLDASTLSPVENCQVRIQHTLESESGLTDPFGNVTLPLVYVDNYQVYAGKWGYVTGCLVDFFIDAATDTIFMLIDQGIYDDFIFDFGWIEAATATNGLWEREVPVGVTSGGFTENPFDDVTIDCGDMAYLTGNGSTISLAQEVDSGVVYLTSPVFDVSGYVNPGIIFSTFFQNLYGSGTPDDFLQIMMMNGTDTNLILDRDESSPFPGEWVETSIEIQDYQTPTATMQIQIIVSDEEINPHLTEGGFDHFRVVELSLSETPDETNSTIQIVPNPFNDKIRIIGLQSGRIQLMDLSGRLVAIHTFQNEIDLSKLQSGVYLISVFNTQGELLTTLKQVKR